MKDTAHYTPLLADSDEVNADHKGFPSGEGEPAVLPRRSEKRSNLFYLVLVAIQALLILGLVLFNWAAYTKLKSAACSQVVYCKIVILAC